MATRSHNSIIQMARYNHKFCANTFFFRTSRLRNTLLVSFFSVNYDSQQRQRKISLSFSFTLSNRLRVNGFYRLVWGELINKGRVKIFQTSTVLRDGRKFWKILEILQNLQSSYTLAMTIRQKRFSVVVK